MSIARDVGREARKATAAGMPWVERLARLGYAAKGIVYIIIGALALRAAAGNGSARVDQKSAFQAILQQPFGQFLLAIVAVGLAGYALWRLIQAVVDPEHEGKQKGGALKRAGYFVSAVSYSALCYAAIQLDLGRGGGQKNAGDFTGAIMKQPAGRWLILLIGLIILAVGLVTIYQAYQSNFEKRFKWNELSADARRLAVLIGRIGYSAKGIVLGIVGLLFAQAALQFDPQKAAGLSEALARLPSQPYGMIVLLVVAIGLIAYGLYALFLSQFRRISVA